MSSMLLMLGDIVLKHGLELLGRLDDGARDVQVDVRAQVVRAENLDGQVRVDFADDLGGVADTEVGVSVQICCDISVCIEERNLTAQLLYLANDHDVATDIRVQKTAIDTRG